MSNNEAKPWPAHWPSREIYLAAIPLEGGGINAIFRNAEPAAEKEGKPINFGFASHAVKRLLKEGALSCDAGIYRLASNAPPKPLTAKSAAHGITVEQITAAIREHFPATSADPDELGDFIASVLGSLGASSVSPPNAPPAEPEEPSLTVDEAIEKVREIITVNESCALSKYQWKKLADAQGISLEHLMSRQREKLLAGVHILDRGADTLYYIGAPPRPTGGTPWKRSALADDAPFAPRPPETEEERLARRAKQKHIVEHMHPDDLAELDHPDID